jgi:hypothetical protein
MRRLILLGGLVALMLLAAVTVAAALAASPSPSPSMTPSASPTPSPKPTKKPSASPSPTASPSTAPSPSTSPSPSSGTTAASWNAQLRPLDAVTGSVTVQPLSAGGAMATIKVSGLDPDSEWTVDIDGGHGTVSDEQREIAFKSGAATQDRTSETVRIRLTKSELAAFRTALSNGGVIVRVTDGTAVSVADISASTTK